MFSELLPSYPQAKGAAFNIVSRYYISPCLTLYCCSRSEYSSSRNSAWVLRLKIQYSTYAYFGSFFVYFCRTFIEHRGILHRLISLSLNSYHIRSLGQHFRKRSTLSLFVLLGGLLLGTRQAQLARNMK